MARFQLGDKVRIARGFCGEGYTFTVAECSLSGFGEPIVYGNGNYGPVRESELELVAIE